MGFNHEQERSDRDDYITVHWDNMPESSYHNFEKDTSASNVAPYDLNSIIHYSATVSFL